MLKMRKVERLAEGVASFDLSSNGERMLVQLKRAEPGATVGETPAQWVLAPAGMPLKAGEGIMGLAGAEVRVDPLAEWKQIYREVWRIEGAISTMLTGMAPTPPRWRKKYEPYVETLTSRGDLNYISPGNAGRPDRESSARRRWHRPAPRQQAKKTPERTSPENMLWGNSFPSVLTLKLN